MTTVVQWLHAVRSIFVHVLTKGSAVTGRSCASVVLVFLGSVCSAVGMGSDRPLSSFDELLSMAVLSASWWMPLMADL